MILIVDMNCKQNSLGFYEFVLPIVSIVKEFDCYAIKHYLVVDGKEADTSNAVILSGTPLKDNATLSQIDEFAWMKTCKAPILGICAGMQTIGLTFGANLMKCVSIGMIKMATTIKNPLFSSTLQVYALHNYSIVPSGEFEILAESEHCVQAVKHWKLDIYGVLFHPEVRNQEILRRFVRGFGKHRIV